MFVNNLINNGVNETRTDNSEGLSPSRCFLDKPGRHEDTTQIKWSKKENKKAIICYMKAKEERVGYHKRMR